MDNPTNVHKLIRLPVWDFENIDKSYLADFMIGVGVGLVSS